MKKNIFLMLVTLLVSFTSFTQTITIIDNTTLQPISEVIIRADGATNSIITNAKGQADISSLKGTEKIGFIHVNYILKVYSYDEIIAMKNQIALSEKAFSFDEVIVSVNRAEEPMQDIAQPAEIITSKDLAFQNAQNSGDALSNTGNVFVQKSQQGGGSPIIRGFETNKVLIVVDGVRMNNAIYRGGHIQNIITLDNTMMDKIEVVYGPGSVMYGSDALGGVMHFYTKNPILSSDGIVVKANAFTRFSTANSEKTGHFDFSIGGKKFGSMTSFTFSDFGDMRFGYNTSPAYTTFGLRTFYADRINGVDTMIINPNQHVQVGSAYSQYDILQKFLFKQNDKVSHVLNFQYSASSNINRYDRLSEFSGSGNPKFAEWYYGPAIRMFASYTLNLTSDKGFYDNGRIIVAYQAIEETRNDRRFKNDNLNHRNENLNIITFNADFTKKVKKHELRYGLDGWYNSVKSTAFQENITTGSTVALDTRYPDGGNTMTSMAAYFSHTFEISDKLILTDGIRVNNISLNSNWNDSTFFPFPFNSVTQNNTALNGSLGLIVMPGAGWRITALASSGFRAPNVDDMTKVFSSTGGNLIVPNPDLKPEYTYNADLGISKTFNDNVVIGANAYYTMYISAITTGNGTFNGADSVVYDGQMSKVTTSVNAAEAYIYGFSAYLKADITENFSLTSTLNYTYGRIKTDTTDYPLDHIAPTFGKTSLNLKVNKFRGEVYAMYSAAKRSSDYNLFGEDNVIYSADKINGYMPAWMTLNIRAAYQFNKYVQLQMSLENVLDQNYRMYASNISAAGRNFVVTLRGTF